MKKRQNNELPKFIFTSALSTLMYARHLSQLALSKKLGIRQSQISNWLHSKSLPGYESIQILCKYFEIEANYFFQVS